MPPAPGGVRRNDGGAAKPEGGAADGAPIDGRKTTDVKMGDGREHG